VLTAKGRSNSSSVGSANGLERITPALFTRMSSQPKRAKGASNSRPTSAGLLTPACTGCWPKYPPTPMTASRCGTAGSRTGW
jgi:hypothetical protein